MYTLAPPRQQNYFMLYGLLLIGISFLLGSTPILAQQIQSARIDNASSNRLTVTFSEPITVTDGGVGFRLVGGVARIDKLLSGSGSSTLTFSLTDYALPDDRFTLLHWPEMSDARGPSGKLGTPDESVVVSNKVSSYPDNGTIIYYVSNENSSDSNSGTSKIAPLKTIAEAQRKAKPGDFILLKRGDSFNGFEITKSGSEGNTITFAAYGDVGDPKPVIKANTETQYLDIGISATNKDHIVIDNLRVEHVDGGIYVYENSSYLVVSNCTIVGVKKKDRAGIRLVRRSGAQQTFVYPQILNNDVSGCDTGIMLNGYPYDEGEGKEYRVRGGIVENNNTSNHANFDTADGITTSRSDFESLVVRKNDISGWSDDGIDMFAASNVIAEYNVLHNPIKEPTNGLGIKAGGKTNKNASGVGDIIVGHKGSNIIVRYNRVFNIKGDTNKNFTGISTNQGASGEIYGNLIYDVDNNGITLDKPQDWKVYNNTIVGADNLGLNVYFETADQGDAAILVIKNNIFQGNKLDNNNEIIDIEITNKGNPNLSISSNAIFNKTSEAYQSSNDVQTNISSLFVNPGQSNFFPKDGSPLINAGTSDIPPYKRDIRGFLVNSNPDIGAYEYNGQSGGLDPDLPKPPADEPPTLFLAGASMTKNDNGLQQGWGEELPALMKEELTIVNGADPGESTKSFVERTTNQGDTFWARLLNQIEAGDYVVLNFGHNDQYMRDEEYRTIAGNEDNNYDGTYKAYLKQMAQDVLNLGATPIIASPAERAIFDNYDLTTSHNNYVPAARRAAQEAGVLYFDMNAGSRDWMNQIGEANIDNYFPGYRRSSPGTSDRSSDITHTNSAGALKNAQVFVDLLQESSSPLKQYIKGAVNPPPSPENGVNYAYYKDETENWSALPDFASLSPEKEGTLENFSLSPAEQADHYGFVYTTYLELDQAGEYTFYLLSDDGSQLLIEGEEVVSYDGRHSASEEQSGKVVLSKGRHRLEVRYFEYRFTQSLLVSYQGPGISKQAIPDEVLFLEDDDNTPEPPSTSANLWLEAECASSVGSAWQTEQDSEASGGEYLVYKGTSSMDQAPSSSSAELVYALDLEQAGSYYLLARLQAPDAAANSVWVKIDEGAWIKWWEDITLGSSFNWNLAPGGAVSLSSGEHTLRVAYRESGTQLDKLLLSTESTLPEGSGPQASNCTSLPPSSQNGVAYRYYEDNTTSRVALPDFSMLVPTKEGVLENFSLSAAEQPDYFLFSYTSYLEVEQGGGYTFFLTSDDGSRLWVNDQLVVDHDGPHGASEKAGSVTLGAGRHKVEVGYFERLLNQVLQVAYQGPGISKQAIPDEVLFLEDDANAPKPPVVTTQVWLEVECADQVGEAWQVVADSEASGGSYLQVQPGNSSVSAAPTASAKQLTFTFSVSQAGEYTLYSRQQENGSNNDDSFWVRANTGSWVKNGLNTPAGSFAWGAARDADNNFSQVTFSLVAGSNTLTLGTREDNLQLDKLYVSLADTAPSGKGGAASNCSSPARQASWAKAGLESESDQLQVYPNPADGQLTLRFSDSYASLQKASVALTDLQGRVVYRGAVGQHAVLSISTAGLPQGVYLLRVSQAQGVLTQKVIVQH